MSTEQYQLIGTEVSLYSGKVRGYLRHKKIPFIETLSTMKIYNDVIMPRVGKRIIPVLLTPDDECIQDTTCIIDYLEARFPEHSVYPETPKQKLVATLLESYGDEWLVMPAMHYRWQFKRHNLRFILKEFGRTAIPNAWSIFQYGMGALPAMAFGNLYKPYFGIDKAMGKAIEQSYEGLLDELNVHLEKYPYLLGNRPSIGDYGFLGPLYAHLYRDPYPGEMMEKRAPYVAKWVERLELMKDAQYGDFLPNDDIPETLIPVLKRMAREQFPVLEKTAAELDKWHVEHADKKNVSRVIGKHDFDIEGVHSTRAITPFSYWMFQRSLATYNAAEDKSVLDELLKKIDGTSAFTHQAKTQLAYENYRLVVKT